MSVERAQLNETSHQIKQTATATATTTDALVNNHTASRDDCSPIKRDSKVRPIGNVGASQATATGGQTMIQTLNVVRAEIAMPATRGVNSELKRETLEDQEARREETEAAAERGQEQLSYNRPQKYCAVCGDKAIACNFNAVTCESCKAFFRRNAFKEQRLRCLFENRCVIDRVTRRFCSKCRLLKCFSIGMKREWILTDEQKQIKRVKIMQNKQARSQLSTWTPVDSESGSGATTPTCPSSITSSLGGDRNGESKKVNHDLKKSLLSSNNDNDDIAESELPPKLKHQVVERRDAATDCPTLGFDSLRPGGGGGGDSHMLRFCTFAHQCHFCSLKLAESTPTPSSHHTMPGAHLPNHPYLQHQHQHQPTHLFGHQQAHIAPGPHHQQQPPQSPPVDAASVYQHQQAAGFYSQPPVIVHHVGLASPNRPAHGLAPPTSSHHRAHQAPPFVSVNTNPTAPTTTCCLSSITWQQHRDTGGICQVHPHLTASATATASPRRLHVMEPTSRAAPEQQQPAVAMSGVGVAAADTPPQLSEPRVATAKDDVKEGLEDSEDEEEEEEEDESKVTAAAVATGAGEAVGVTGAASANIEQEQHEWRGETYCAPAGTEPEIWARVKRLGFGETEQQLVREMLDATRLVFEPQERMSNDSVLDDIVFFCDAALRRLIKTVKQISSFRVLNMDDQIVLLKNACFKILLLRSSFHYNDDIEGWRDKSGCVLPLLKLKTEKCRNYERHKAIMDKLSPPLRRDRLLMAFMILIILFDPTVSLKHANSVQLDNMLYLYTLRKYLVGTQPEPLAKYERMVETLQVITDCYEEYNLFFSRNYQPEEITPLLVEIFDISTNDIPM